jgi:cobalt-zinc-cadmium efflux system outer membrane protein
VDRLRHLTAVLGLLAAALLFTGRAHAASPEEGRGAVAVTLARAIEDGARHGPAVVESSKNRGAAEAFARNPGSSLPSVPQAVAMAGARRPYNLPAGPELSVTVQQEISMRGLGSARRRAAEWAARAAATDVERARIEGGAMAALAWIDLLEAQDLLQLRTATADDAARLARIAEVRVTSGVATAVERSLAKAEVGSARLAILDAEGRATEARLALAHATGASMQGAVVADGRLDGTDESPIDERTVVDGVAHHPAVRAAEARASQTSAEGSVARATAGPSFSVGATLWREGSGDHAAAAIVSIPLPFFDPARYDVGRQSTIATAAQSHATRLRAELEREARLALHDHEHTREVRTQLREGVVQPTKSALDTAMTAYAAGTSDLGVVLLARRSALAAEERLVIAMADVWRADIRLSALAGTLLRDSAR